MALDPGKHSSSGQRAELWVGKGHEWDGQLRRQEEELWNAGVPQKWKQMCQSRSVLLGMWWEVDFNISCMRWPFFPPFTHSVIIMLFISVSSWLSWGTYCTSTTCLSFLFKPQPPLNQPAVTDTISHDVVGVGVDDFNWAVRKEMRGPPRLTASHSFKRKHLWTCPTLFFISTPPFASTDPSYMFKQERKSAAHRSAKRGRAVDRQHPSSVQWRWVLLLWLPLQLDYNLNTHTHTQIYSCYRSILNL